MRRLKIAGALLMILALLVVLLPVSEAAAATSASDFVIKSGVLLLYKGQEKVVTVPKTVQVIGEGAFEENDTVTKIILPDSVQQIEAYAFWDCDNLKTVVLGKGLKEIGDFAFTNCVGLQTMELPSNIERIGIQAFASCRNLESITVPVQVHDIREDSFDEDYLLVIHCESGSYADQYAQKFYERQKNMSVPDKEILSNSTNSGEDSSDASAATSPSRPSISEGIEIAVEGGVLGSTHVVNNKAVVMIQSAGMQTAGEKSPSEKPNQAQGGFVGTVVSGDTVVERAHYRDADIIAEVLDSGIREISQFAYARSTLAVITFPQGLKKIDYAAFYHCDLLTKVELPDSVMEVEAKAFAHTPWVDRFLDRTDDREGDFLVSGGVLIAYRGDGTTAEVPEGVRVIAGEAFAGHSELEKIRIPSTVVSIDEKAFADCGIQKIDYEGDRFGEEYLEKRIQIAQQSASPIETAVIPTWLLVCAAGMFLVGNVLVWKK